jgi:sulfatase maturation enzyme AslB (radical SAM superfamily)
MFDKKILCLGNNSLDTDQRTSNLASQDSTINHGVIDSIDFLPELPGYYHTSIIDLSAGEIIKIAKKFNNIILLDQPRSEWSHETVLKSTISLMVNLDQLGLPTKYKDNNNLKNINFWNKLVTENKSFCIHPWILMNEIDGKAVLCPRDSNPVTNKPQNIISWQTDANYQSIRQRMLEGTIIPDHCGVCYDYEDRGIESYRQFETKDWANRLHLNSLDDLKNITAPYFYDIRLSNKCNMMCRSCNPLYSNLIAKESKKFNIVYKVSPSYTYSKLDCIDIDRLTPKTRVYLTGGEPTVMTEIYDWMQQCIDAGQTDFDFTLGTNGQRLNKRFLKLIKHFTNLNFSISLDGYGRINEYWRWGSNFDTITKNIHTLKNQGHNISINCVPGIYNVTNLHLLLEFLDQELPMTTIYMQLNYVDFQSAYNHPIPELVLKSMERCKNTSVYYADGKSNKTTIDSLYDYYSSNPTCDLALLKEFFDYNDKLDQARNVRLVDYIPELEACRKYLK